MLRICVLGCAMAVSLALVVGCTSSSDTGNGKPVITQAQKDEAVRAINDKLAAIDKKLEELKTRAEKATGEEKAKLEAKWQESAGKREALKKKYDELKSAAADKWEVIKNEAEHAYNELKKAIE